MDQKENNQNRAQLLREYNPFMMAHEIIYTLMLEDIVSCRLQPGERLTEEQCSELYGCSRSTIRKIFDRLVDEDWLDRSESHRIKVHNISLENHMETMDFRMAIEPAAARLAAKNRSREDMKLIERYIMRCDTTDIYQFHLGDLGFHRAVFAACKNKYLITAYQQIDLLMARAKLYTAGDFVDMCKECFQEHLQIFQAIKARDGQAAYRLSKQHIKLMLDANI